VTEKLKSFVSDKPQKVKGKTINALAYSKSRRKEIIKLFGGEIPTSIMVATKNSKISDKHAANSYLESMDKTVKGIKLGRNKTGFPSNSILKLASGLGRSSQGGRRGALSKFPDNVGNILIRLYTNPGDVFVDPFAGHNSRMEMTVREGRNYHGYDISHNFMEINKEIAVKLRKQFECKIELFEQDSRDMKFTSDEYGDFTITSPPYWDIEQYGDEPEQLGKQVTYRKFMKNLFLIMKENYRCLKHGAYCAWFVNDFRKGGVFYSYHNDTITCMKKAGFTIKDIVIIDLGYPFGATFAQKIIETKTIPKRHEYGLIFKKE